MEDAVAALDFARSPAGAGLGIDPRHIVLAGHSMGGATAAMTASSAIGLDGLILIDAWNVAGGTSKGVTRDALVRGFDDFGNSLHGATPESVADEAVAKGSQWDLVKAGGRMHGLRVLTVNARYGIGERNRPVTAAMKSSGAQVTAIEMDTDHSFSDHRIALSSAIVNWLDGLRH
jgi:uncharacterized protein